MAANHGDLGALAGAVVPVLLVGRQQRFALMGERLRRGQHGLDLERVLG
jgi:hypothetical protein